MGAKNSFIVLAPPWLVLPTDCSAVGKKSLSHHKNRFTLMSPTWDLSATSHTSHYNTSKISFASAEPTVQRS